jgi:hypothetical protein
METAYKAPQRHCEECGKELNTEDVRIWHDLDVRWLRYSVVLCQDCHDGYGEEDMRAFQMCKHDVLIEALRQRQALSFP